MTAKEILTEKNLNWSVRDEVLTTESGILLPNYKAIVRDDTNTVLGVHGSGYQAFQNDQLLELLFRVSQQTGLQVHRGGFFGNGEKVFIQLKSNDLKIGNDEVKGFITGINSFDGSTNLGFGTSTITISCTNSFYGAFRSLQNKVKHTKNMLVRLEDILQAIDVTLSEEKHLFDHIQRFSEIRMSEADMDKVIRSLFGIKKEVSLTDFDVLSTRTQNNIAAFRTAANIEITDKGENLWGLFSGVTRFTTHNLPKTQSNDEQKMFGLYGRREQQIFNELAVMVS